MNRSAVCAVLVLTFAATARAGDLDNALAKVRASHNSRGTVETHKVDPAGALDTVTVAAPAPSSDSTVEQFNIGVEYHAGIMSKHDNHIGTAVMRCHTTGPDTFEVTLSGHATTPDKKREKVDFSTVRKFKINGNIVTVVGSEDDFKGSAEKYKTKILNTVALAYLIKFRAPIYGEQDPAPVVYEVDGKKYQFSFVRLGRNGKWSEVQVSLHDMSENNRTLGKFFLEPAAAAPSPFRKFRIQTKDKLGINFFTI